MKYRVYLLARLLLLVITPNNGLAGVSLRNGEDQQRRKLYPNPAKDAVTIEYSGLSEGSKLYVSDALGVLHEMQLLNGAKGKLVINTNGYTNGIYLARVETEGDAPLKNKFVILR